MKKLIKFLKQTVFFGLFFSAIVLGFFRLMICPLPFPVTEALGLLVKMFLTTCIIVILAKVVFEGLILLIVKSGDLIQNKEVEVETEPGVYYQFHTGNVNPEINSRVAATV